MKVLSKEVFFRLYSIVQCKICILPMVIMFALQLPSHAQVKNINKISGTISIPTQNIDSVWFDSNTGEMKIRKQDGTLQGHLVSEVNNFTFGANIYPSNGVYCNNLPTVPVEVTNATTGRIWMDRNLGASRAALSPTDSLAYGDLYQWGRGADGHQCRNSPTTAVLSSTVQPGNGEFILTNFPDADWLVVPNNNLWQGFAGVNNPCPAGFRLPTANEMQEERASWPANNIAGAFSNNLKWTLAGFRDFDGAHNNVNQTAYYWCSNIDLNDARYLTINTSTAAVLSCIRSLGLSVRCIKDNTYGDDAIYCNGSPTQVVEVTSPTGKVWMDRNLGASQAATSINDVNAYGDLYQWGRRADGHQCRNSSTTSVLSSSAEPGHGDFIINNNTPWNWQNNLNNNLWQGVEAINNPCPAGFRLPSAAEVDAERFYWISQDAAGAFASPLKFTLPGYRSGNAGQLSDVGNLGYYWTNSVNLSAVQALSVGSATASLSANLRTYGFSVRCIKQTSFPENTVSCSSNPTLVVDVTNPSTGKTWMDRNLGASQVAQSSTDALAYGDLYQWGRRADGHQCRYSLASADLSNGPEPANSDFILSNISPNDWLSSPNTSLWQGANGLNNPCPNGYRLPTESELEAERLTWNSNNAAGAFASSLKWPMAGDRAGADGLLYGLGAYGDYWSSTLNGTGSSRILFGSNNAAISANVRSDGNSVRCIKEATNTTAMHSCGADNVHNSNLTYGSMTDQDGNNYKTIVIGGREWMAENLKVSHYRNGDAIPVLSDSTAWVNTSSGATSWYNNDSVANTCPYGKLYNWYAVHDARGLCPSGWYVPSDSEWNKLAKQLDPSADTTCVSCFQSNTAGGKMKSMGTLYWQTPNAGADNSSGFSGLPGGYRNFSAMYANLGQYSPWWSSTQVNTTNAWYRYLDFNNGNLYRFAEDHTLGYGVRCIKAETITGSLQHSCGADSVHNPNLTYGSMTDQDGNVYKTIVIGTQEWMAENLKASHYRNGELIPVLTDSAAWVNTSGGATCWYNNDSAMYNCPYGKLYNWYAVSDARNLCPTGWHVPTDAEWTILGNYLGVDTIAGGKMKSTGTQYWFSPNTGADNSSGFSGLPGGDRNDAGSYGDVGFNGVWWSSSQGSSTDAWFRTLDYANGHLNSYGSLMRYGFSVRCLRD